MTDWLLGVAIYLASVVIGYNVVERWQKKVARRK